jgi:hypothetical protein
MAAYHVPGSRRGSIATGSITYTIDLPPRKLEAAWGWKPEPSLVFDRSSQATQHIEDGKWIL